MSDGLIVDLAGGTPGMEAALEARGTPLVVVATNTSTDLGDAGHLTKALLRHPMPVTGVVSGRVAGDAATLLLACDHLLMARRSSLAFGAAGRGEAVLLALRIGQAGASRVWFGGGKLTASEAVRSGWAEPFLGEPDGAARRAGERYRGLSVEALALLRPLLYHEAGMPLGAAWALERAAFALAFDTGHPAEGVAAFLGKRKPRF